MKVEIYRNEILFPVNGEHDEKKLYEDIANVLRGFDETRIGENVSGPWCDYRRGSVNGTEFKLVYDFDDDETYITSGDKSCLEMLKVKLMEAK